MYRKQRRRRKVQGCYFLGGEKGRLSSPLWLREGTEEEFWGICVEGRGASLPCLSFE